MVHFLNILSFLMELTFGRDASARRTRSQTISMALFIIVMGSSLYANYYFIGKLYASSAKYVAAKEQMANHEELKLHVVRLEEHVRTLEGVIVVIAPTAVGNLPASPARNPWPKPLPGHSETLPVTPPRNNAITNEKDKQHITAQ